MTATPPKLKMDELTNLGESWIELSQTTSPTRVTPLPFASGEEYLKLLREAQRESNQSSRVVSLASSIRGSPRGSLFCSSPKSPPNSPNPELCNDEELKGIYINRWNKEKEADSKDWVWEWSSRPDQQPPKDWKFEHPTRRAPGPFNYSMRLARVGKNSLFSREVLYSLLLTNVLSLILGAGVGVWLSKRGGILLTRVSIE